MDLDELLSYKPQKKATKRPLDSDQVEQDDSLPSSKVPHRNEGVSGSSSNAAAQGQSDGDTNGISDEEKLRLLQSLDDEDEPGEVLDAGAVKRMLLGFEKKVLKNQEMRIKFPDMPEKFMESELELNDEIQKLHVIATVPEYYPILIETNAVQTIVGLLSHDNSDVSIAVIDLLQELTDVDSVTESEEEAEALIDALLSEQIVALFVQNLERLDEKGREDFDGVHNMLAIVENMCEFKSTEVCAAASDQGLLVWLLKRIRIRQYDSNKLYASEILAILLQGNETNQRNLGEKDGIDILLQALAYYKRRDPHSLDEIEMMENLFDCLCSCLMCAPNRDRFLKGEGLQLMLLMLKEKKLSRRSALKVLNHAMCNQEGADNCSKFVEVYGLRSLFPAFMKTPKTTKKSSASVEEHEEHVCSIIGSLFRNIRTPNMRERLVGKFLENDLEKTERLMELHFKYLHRVREAEEKLRREKRMRASIDSDETEAEVYLKRLDAGLFTLQQVDYVMAELYMCDASAIKARVTTLLNQHGDTIDTVREMLLEYADSVGEGSGASSSDSTTAKNDRERLTALAGELQ